jgi:hypothetical protein
MDAMAVHEEAPAPWERQSGESFPAFEAYALYRDLGPQRSIRAVAQQLGKRASLIGRWSARDHWQSRVRCWELEQDRLKRQAQLDEVDAMGRRHAQGLERQLEVLSLPTVELLGRLTRDETLLKAVDTETLLKLAVKTARPMTQVAEAERSTRVASDLEAGCPTCAEKEASRKWVEAMSPEELRAYLFGRQDTADWEEDERDV